MKDSKVAPAENYDVWMEPQASHLQGKSFATGLHPSNGYTFFFFWFLTTFGDTPSSMVRAGAWPCLWDHAGLDTLNLCLASKLQPQIYPPHFKYPSKIGFDLFLPVSSRK